MYKNRVCIKYKWLNLMCVLWPLPYTVTNSPWVDHRITVTRQDQTKQQINFRGSDKLPDEIQEHCKNVCHAGWHTVFEMINPTRHPHFSTKNHMSDMGPHEIIYNYKKKSLIKLEISEMYFKILIRVFGNGCARPLLYISLSCLLTLF